MMIVFTKPNGKLIALRAEDIERVDDQGTDGKTSVWIRMRSGDNHCIAADKTVREIAGAIDYHLLQVNRQS